MQSWVISYIERVYLLEGRRVTETRSITQVIPELRVVLKF